MNHEGILGWLYHCALNKLFESDLRSMALALRVGERTLERALEQENGAESVLLFEQLMRYCMEHNISMDAMLAEYMGSRGE
jgi:transcription termination factor NusB